MPKSRPLLCLLGLAGSLISLLLIASTALAQDPPSTDVFLVSLELTETDVKLGKPTNVTSREGYDNQPFFLPDGKRFVYTAMADGQTDIWAYDLETKERSQLTRTPESEYSPTPIPGEDSISVIRVEADGTQRLWRFPLDGGDPDLLLPSIAPVGYHSWCTARDLALFVLGEPHELQFAQRGAGTGEVKALDIGRALHCRPGTHLASFVYKDPEGSWSIRRINLQSGDLMTLAPTRPEREDFTWLGADRLLMGDGSKLYVTRPDSGEWKRVADFKKAKLSEITRIAVHPQGTWVAFVALPPSP